MDWNYQYFMPQNNPFRKEWQTEEKHQVTQIVVKETNKKTPCVSCGRRVGDVLDVFYEIDKEYYCFDCGFNIAEGLEETATL
jgi:DNA-directed RNA polymerase subunit N (RpoN/RPB10)